MNASEDKILAVVLAAGKGTRMKSDLAKVLHPVAGKPMLAHVLDRLVELKHGRTVVVVGHQAEMVAEICASYGAETALQAEQLGTGHAVLQAAPLLREESGRTLILCGDVPLLRSSTIKELLAAASQPQVGGAVLSAITDDASGYGRILRDESDHVIGIVEEKDATDEQRTIREYNTGTYCFRNDLLWDALDRVGSDNAQNEFYLTDVIEILVGDGQHVAGVVAPDEREVQGVNTVEDLKRAEADRTDLLAEDSG